MPDFLLKMRELLLWLPVLAALTTTLCLSVKRLRSYADSVFYVSVFTGLSVLCSFWMPYPTTGLLTLVLGDTIATWIGLPLVVIAGAWLGLIASRALNSTGRHIALHYRFVFLIVGFIIAQFFYLMPEAFTHEVNAGGSGGWWDIENKTGLPYLLMLKIYPSMLDKIISPPLDEIVLFWIGFVTITLVQLGSFGAMVVELYKRRIRSKRTTTNQ